MAARQRPPTGWQRREVSGCVYYVVGDSADVAARPTVVLLHEVTGISGDLIEWAIELARSFRVLVPALLDREGRPGYLRAARALCVRREIHVFATGHTSPVVTRLREMLAVEVPDGVRCGVIGMCLSGGFALALAVDQRVAAAVVAQPSLPVHGPRMLPGSAGRAAELGLSPADQSALGRRQNGTLAVRAFRFEEDRISPPERLESITELLGPDVARPCTLPGGRHSTLTGAHRSSSAVADVIAFLGDRLGPPQHT